MKKPIRFLLCITAALLTLFGGILLLSVAAAGAVTLDQSQGDLLITGSQAVQQTPQGELKRSGSSFIITGQANGHTVRIRKATVPISIQADLDTGGDPIISSSTVGISEGIHVSAPSITHAASGKVAVTQYPVWFSGLTPNQHYTVQVGSTLSLERQGGEALTSKSTDIHGSLGFWRRKGETLSVVVQDSSNLYLGALQISGNNALDETALTRITFAGGTGSAADPYLLSEEGQLTAIASRPDAAYQLIRSGLVVREPLCASFSGSFDGNGHSLTLQITNAQREAQVGLFGTVSLQGAVRRLFLSGRVDASGQGSCAGSICGTNFGTIYQDCVSSAAVSGVNAAGGLCGSNQGVLNGCGFTGSVKGGVSCGGIAAFNQNDLRGCFSDAAVSGSYAGGICAGSNGVIAACYSCGEISGNQSAGGITAVQNAGGSIESCYATGVVTGGSYGGGLCGSLTGGKIQESFALNRAVWGKQAAAISGTSQPEAFTRNFAYEYTYVNGQLPNKGQSGADTLHGMPLTRLEVNYAASYLEAGFGEEGMPWRVSDGMLPQLSWGGVNTVSQQPNQIPEHLRATVDVQQENPTATGKTSTIGYTEDFWTDLGRSIRQAQPGDVLRFSTRNLQNLPAGILRQLNGKDVTLSINHSGQTVLINGLRMYDIPTNQVFYTWENLVKLYEIQPAAPFTPQEQEQPPIPERPTLPEPASGNPPLWQVSL